MDDRQREEILRILQLSGLWGQVDPADCQNVLFPKAVTVLRVGTPGCVLRVNARVCGTVIVKSCPLNSREPEVTVWAGKVLDCVPEVYRIAEGSSERVLVMEDMGDCLLWKHPSLDAYILTVEELARIHDVFRGRVDLNMPGAAMDVRRWIETVMTAAEDTVKRFGDRTYKVPDTLLNRGCRSIKDEVMALAQTTALAVERHRTAFEKIPPTLTHGDFHEGNIVLKETGASSGNGIAGVLDWSSSRWDTGLSDLVSLIDVADRMKTLELDERLVLDRYLAETRRLGVEQPVLEALHTVWEITWVLRAWEELMWFSVTGDDFGERALRELCVIRKRLSLSRNKSGL